MLTPLQTLQNQLANAEARLQMTIAQGQQLASQYNLAVDRNAVQQSQLQAQVQKLQTQIAAMTPTPTE